MLIFSDIVVPGFIILGPPKIVLKQRVNENFRNRIRNKEALKFRKLLVIYLEENSDSQILDDAIEAAFESHLGYLVLHLSIDLEV